MAACAYLVLMIALTGLVAVAMYCLGMRLCRG